VPRPPFDPSRARGDTFERGSFEGGLFDPTPVTRRADAEGAEPRERSSEASREASKEASREASGEAARGESRPREFTVSAFSELIARTLEDGLRGNHRIVGEIANLSVRRHWYFSIKDASSVLSCVMWQSDAARVGFSPKEGDAVVVTGKIGHYAPQGRTQFYATRLEEQGLGDLERRFRALVEEFRARGAFADERKKPLPAHPRRVAVVTSATGAALQDVRKTAIERRAGVEFVVIDVRVQGEAATAEIARALRAVARLARPDALGLDAVILTRGGGSREDLWAFNEREVVEAALALPIPLVAAIGHEVDTSVVELVADRRASTPTQAAMLLLPDRAALFERSDRIARDLRQAMRWSLRSRSERVAELERSLLRAAPALRLARARERVAWLGQALSERLRRRIAAGRAETAILAQRLARQSPQVRVRLARTMLTQSEERLARAIARRLGDARRSLGHLEQRLRSAGPEAALSRGYAIVTDGEGRLVRSVAAAAEGATVRVEVADGRFAAKVVRDEEAGKGGRRGRDHGADPQEGSMT
jgi:exodeoxyribonuclease VII large subunit